MNSEKITEKIKENLNSSDQFDDWDKLQSTDADYMMYSPTPVGYNTTAEQRYLMQNLLTGFYNASILDIGCGRADLYDFLTNFYPDLSVAYHGIDHNPIMTALAKEKYDTECITGAFETAKMPKAEWVVANGVFTPRRCETEDEDLRKLFEDIDILYKHAQVAVSFNLLNPINNTHHEGFFYVHPGLILDMLIEKYENVVLRNNYSKDIYTVTIYKNQ
jgi:SAM-dependent methyltransferase